MHLHPPVRLRSFAFEELDPSKFLEIISKNAVLIDLPHDITIHPVVHVEHTAPAFRQPEDIRAPFPERTHPFIDAMGEQVIEVEAILAHRRKQRGLQFLTQFRNTPAHEAEWKPLRDFLDNDGTITPARHSYITLENIQPHLH